MNRRRMEEEEAPTYTTDLHVKYRPRSFDDVVGQRAVVKSLRTGLKDKARPHTYAFIGPGGTGKTTLARIMAHEMGCVDTNIIEVDAASNSGKDDMTALVSTLKYQGFGDTPTKMVIIDECQRLSKEAWDVLLKPTEEPSEHVYFAFCTTDARKIPAAMMTRFRAYTLAPVADNEMFDLLLDIVKAEKFDTPDDIIDAVVNASHGSPRQALVNLAKVHAAEDARDAIQLMQGVAEEKEVIDVVRALVNGNLTWKSLQSMLKAMPAPDAEGIRIVVSCYCAACIASSKNDRDIENFLAIAYEFRTPYNPTDKMMPLFLSFGRLINDQRR